MVTDWLGLQLPIGQALAPDLCVEWRLLVRFINNVHYENITFDDTQVPSEFVLFHEVST